MSKRENEKGEKKKKHRKIHEITAENDIRYRGPLSYRHFKIFGWFCLVCAQIGLIANTGLHLFPEKAARFTDLAEIMGALGDLALPFILFANFSIILNTREGYKNMLLRYTGLVLSIWLTFLLFYIRYLRGALVLIGGPQLTPELFVPKIAGSRWSGFVDFNIFVDLLLCTLYMFFLNYQPKRLFKGKSLIFFRLMALLPILYELGTIILEIQAGRGKIVMPFWMFPLLPTKPPLAFIMFALAGLILKKRERRYVKKGKKTREDYEAFWHTNTNSWHFSLFTSLVVLVIVVLDVILYLLLSTVIIIPDLNPWTTEAEVEAMIEWSTRLVAHLGIGNCIPMIIMIPFLLLFSYTRKHKNQTIDSLIPLAGIAMIIFVYLEGFYRLLQMVLPDVIPPM